MCFTKLQAISLSLLVGHVGCSSSGPFKGDDFEAARKAEVYPYAVKVIVNQAETSIAQGVLNPRLVSQDKKADIELQLVKSLEEYRVFAWPYASQELRPSNQPADLELVVTINAEPGRQLGNVTRNGYIWPNLFLWILAGFPAWLLEDTQVDTGIQVAYVLKHESGIVHEGSVNLTGEERLNFWDRAGVWQYVQQLIVPPFLVGSNKDIADATLYEKFMARMQGEIGASLKRDLWAKLYGKSPEPFPVLVALPNESAATIVLLCGNPVARIIVEPDSGQSAPEWEPIFEKDVLEAELLRLKAPEPILALTKSFGEPGAYDYCYVLRSHWSRKSLSWKEGTMESPRIKASFQGGNPTLYSWTPRFVAGSE